MLHNAHMISPAVELGSAPLFRTEISPDPGHGDVAAATLRISSLGVHEARINGTPVGDDVLSPGWTSYEHRLRYLSHDVTALISGPDCVLTVLVGNGWHRGRLGFMGGRAFYGDRLGVIAELEIVFADGHRQVVVTDETWTAGNSDVLADDLYNGQTIDARRRSAKWHTAGGEPEWFLPVRALDFDASRLTPYIGGVVTRQEVLPPQRVWTSPAGRTLIDFGQNLVGWLRFTVRGPAGTEIRVRHAEVLENGELGVRPLRDAQATDRFVLSGDEDFFEPTMTFHGFRYAEITGWPAGAAMDVEAVVVHSALRRTGEFACSDELLNQLHRNVVWSTKGNFLDLPTDCPQRNERLGWTGDIAVFASSAAYLFDVGGFLGDWLADLAAEQRAADGLVPFVIPDVLKYQPHPPEFPDPDSTAFWSDAAVWVPWALWQAYGDLAILRTQYPSMTAHVRRVRTLLSPAGVWDSSFQFGDWLDPDAPADAPAKAKADPGVVATAAYYRSLTLVAETAALLGHDDDAAEFGDLARQVREAFNEQYVDAAGTVRSDCATVYTLAIVFGLLDDPQAAGRRLADLVADSGYRVSTGFAGTPYITEALTVTGHLDAAYRLLLERECPSWLYPVTMGATTIWERWDSMLPDGSVNPGEMTSFNHYALGAVADWMHRTIGGIAPLEPGYARVRVAPRPGGGLTWCRSALETRHGRIEVSWRIREDGELDVDVTLPDGVSGVLSLEGKPDVPL
ncbi:putative alpha-L-rhamnosidase [Actinoplanes missouriensis 431]|uniref:alpha-L-rhamnosidase n=1 Tax=Actinoplanes missouriensis (strain ATCC 14538 / DSM 43046 / CBS 188.64 / JCM 3121 / NBRC 102363 / NCIMB 12654 / NRRL B-3342 / UNCC 431) TaxID=512565 RepID=I0HA94_ACTM4|nr:alpha-L-rhamnosidase [Actinoplanes missouriensis]BAL89931.1 putative alpha-L-rhamnosidase [Actinoplanes missouriensis 431]